MLSNSKKGFVVPLLIVIIIILVVGIYMYNQQMLSLGRSEARDALIQSDLSSVQTQAKINYGNAGNTYVSICADSFIANALTHIRTAVHMVPICNSSATAFAASSPLATDGTKFWCVDSTGFDGQTTTPLGASTVCPK